jgi:energy-coupling factor transport system ATP-binding protein
VPSGGSLLVLGPSGCGKSTLSLCLNGAIPHFVEGYLEGRVRIGGLDTREGSMAQFAQRVGVVFQDPEAQFCMLTLEEEVAFGLENLAVDPAEMDPRIEEALDWVGLGDRRRDKIEQLSGGQKQRLALACVLAQRPEVLVFDEPTAQLDPAGAADVIAMLERLRAGGRHTLIIIEHRLDDLMPLVDDVLVLNQSGEAVVTGTPRKVMREWGDWLKSAGVWVPQVSELATGLADIGLTLEPFPLTIDEAVTALAPHTAKLRLRETAAAITPSVPFIEARHVHFRYPRSAGAALDNVSLTLNSGELTAIAGANGAGKTTFAQLLVGILRPRPGEVSLGGRDLADIKPAELARQVGYVFQYPEHQFVGGSVLDDVAFGMRRAGLSQSEARTRAEEMLDEFGLGALALAHPFSLSHGEQRRLSVAAMLILGQRGLFLDEPTFGQDRRNAHVLLDKLVALTTTGRAVVAITHDMRLVAERAERVVVMSNGALIFDGTPADLFSSTLLLHKARLRPPPLTVVSQRLGLVSPLLRVDDLIQALAPSTAIAS